MKIAKEVGKIFIIKTDLILTTFHFASCSSCSFSYPTFFSYSKMEHLKNLHFTPETPFGLPLYPFFEKAYEAVVGEPASKFRYIPSVTPLSTVNEGNSRDRACWDKTR